MSDYYIQNPAARWLALASICIATFLVPLSMSAINIALPAIANELQADAVLISWVPTSNLLGSMMLMLPAARVADIVGRKKVYIVGVLMFCVTSLMVIWIETIEWLLVSRFLQGLASAMVFGTGMAIVTSVFANGKRGTALGLTATSVYLGLTCGPMIGGWLTEVLGWRSVFWAPVPFALISVLLVVMNVKGEYKAEGKQKLDWVGSGLFALWISAFFFGLSGLPDPSYFICLLAGVALFFLFLRQQGSAEYPLVRLKVLANNKVFSRSMISSVFMYGAHYPVLFLMSLYLQYLKGMSPSESGQLILLQALVMACLAPFAGRLSDQFEPRIIATTGCLIYGSGFAMLLWIDASSSQAYIAAALLALGMGFGLFSTPNNNAAMGSVPPDRLSIGSALMNLSRTMGNMFSMTLVVLLVNLVMGEAEITPEQYPDLLRVIKVAFALALAYTLVAAYASYSRGNVRSS